MNLTERLQEAFDKRVCGTAMIPASDLLSAMTALEQLKETISQQSAVIEQMRDALVATRDDLEIRMKLADDDSLNISNSVLDQMCDAIDLQPSPEILQARDEKVAEACAVQATNWGNARLDDNGGHALRNCAAAIRRGEWRKYL